jgi:hypothetical protein
MLQKIDVEKRIPYLIDLVREIVESQRAPEWGDLWERSTDSKRTNMFSVPNPIAGSGLAPYVFFPDANFYARLFGYSLEQVFTDVKTFISFELEQRIWNYENLKHDSHVGKTIAINQLGWFAPSLFGVETIYADDAIPWIGKPVIHGIGDLHKMVQPDFYQSGLMPLVHQMYAEAQTVLPNDFEVVFTSWISGPFSVIYHLRGACNLAMDIIENPGFVHDMMGFITECMKQWWTDRGNFIGESQMAPIILGNDEVGVPFISPAHYEEFILPYEIDLSKFFGGIDYWHSCSDITLLLPFLSRIPNLRVMDVGPWTALEPAVNLFGRREGSSLMKRLHPVSEVLYASEKEMRERLLQIKAVCYDIPYLLFFDGLNVLDSLEQCESKIRLLDKLCHEIFHCNTHRPVIEKNPN